MCVWTGELHWIYFLYLFCSLRIFASFLLFVYFSTVWYQLKQKMCSHWSNNLLNSLVSIFCAPIIYRQLVSVQFCSFLFSEFACNPLNVLGLESLSIVEETAVGESSEIFDPSTYVIPNIDAPALSDWFTSPLFALYLPLSPRANRNQEHTFEQLPSSVPKWL